MQQEERITPWEVQEQNSLSFKAISNDREKIKTVRHFRTQHENSQVIGEKIYQNNMRNIPTLYEWKQKQNPMSDKNAKCHFERKSHELTRKSDLFDTEQIKNGKKQFLNFKEFMFTNRPGRSRHRKQFTKDSLKNKISLLPKLHSFNKQKVILKTFLVQKINFEKRYSQQKIMIPPKSKKTSDRSSLTLDVSQNFKNSSENLKCYNLYR